MFALIFQVQFNTIKSCKCADGASLFEVFVVAACNESPLGSPLTCREWMGMEQRPQLFRWQTASTVAALSNSISLLSSSCWDTENRTWNTPLPGRTDGRQSERDRQEEMETKRKGQVEMGRQRDRNEGSDRVIKIKNGFFK